MTTIEAADEADFPSAGSVGKPLSRPDRRRGNARVPIGYLPEQHTSTDYSRPRRSGSTISAAVSRPTAADRTERVRRC